MRSLAVSSALKVNMEGKGGDNLAAAGFWVGGAYAILSPAKFLLYMQ